jgi:hypothetical protein
MGALFAIAFVIAMAVASPLAVDTRELTPGNKILG